MFIEIVEGYQLRRDPARDGLAGDRKRRTRTPLEHRLVSAQFVGGRLGRSRFLRFSSSRRASSSALGTARTCFTNSSNLARETFGDPGLLLAKGVLPDQLPVGDSPSDDPRRGGNEPRGIGKLARVEAIRRLVQIAVKVLGIDGVVSPVNHPLEQRPEVLQAVRVDAVPHVSFGVVDDLMHVVGLKTVVRTKSIRVDMGTGSNACTNLILNGPPSPARDDARANLRTFAVALKQSHDGNLAHSASPDVLLLVLMLEPRLAANESLIGLNLTRKGGVEVSNLHRQPNPMRHEPRGFLSHAKVSRELVRRNTLLKGRVHPERREPLGEGDGRVLKDGALLDRELVLASLAAPQGASRDIAILGRLTARANGSVRPAQGCHEVTADSLVREVSDRFDQGFGELAGLHVSECTT